MDIEKLKALALAATPGPWRGDHMDGTVKYWLIGANDEPVIRGDNGNSDSGPFGIDKEEDEAYLLGCHPAAVLDLIAEVERLRAELAARCRAEGGDTSIKNLTRWTFDRGMTAEVSTDGQWVAYNDLEVLVERQRAAPAAGTVKDAERLDWLEARQATLTRLYDNSGYILAIDGRAIKTAITARRAIDAAIESHAKAGSPA